MCGEKNTEKISELQMGNNWTHDLPYTSTLTKSYWELNDEQVNCGLTELPHRAVTYSKVQIKKSTIQKTRKLYFAQFGYTKLTNLIYGQEIIQGSPTTKCFHGFLYTCLVNLELP